MDTKHADLNYKQLYLKSFNALTEVLELVQQKQLELEEAYLNLPDEDAAANRA